MSLGNFAAVNFPATLLFKMKSLACRFALVWFVTSGCATLREAPVDLSTRRGVHISTASADALRKSLIAFFTHRDYALYDSNRRTLNFDRPASRWESLRHSSFVSPKTFARVKIFLMDAGQTNYWVGFKTLIVTDRGSSFEREKPLHGKAAAELQSLLNLWKSQWLSSFEQ